MIIAPRLRPTRSGLFFLGTIALVVTWDVVVTVLFFGQPEWFTWGEFPFALFGSAIALFIGVAINSAYGRWWEARTLWGQVVNSSRSLGRQAVSTTTCLQEPGGASSPGRVHRPRCSLAPLTSSPAPSGPATSASSPGCRWNPAW